MKKLIIFTMVLFTSGCAFTVHDVYVDYKYEKPIEYDFVPRQLEVGDVKDSRGAENPRMIMNMTNLNGATTSGGWQAEKALNEIVKDAVIQGLSNSNIDLSNPESEIKLSGELLAFDVETIMGAWQGTYKGKMTAKFELVDLDSGNIVWRDTFIGSAQVKGGEGVVGVLKETLDDLVTKFLNDKYFQQKIRN